MQKETSICSALRVLLHLYYNRSHLVAFVHFQLHGYIVLRRNRVNMLHNQIMARSILMAIKEIKAYSFHETGYNGLFYLL